MYRCTDRYRSENSTLLTPASLSHYPLHWYIPTFSKQKFPARYTFGMTLLDSFRKYFSLWHQTVGSGLMMTDYWVERHSLSYIYIIYTFYHTSLYTQIYQFRAIFYKFLCGISPLIKVLICMEVKKEKVIILKKASSFVTVIHTLYKKYIKKVF